MTIGIICEYNPFHNGHLHHLNEIKKLYPNSTIILVMSTNFTQRGELSIINKWDKTDISIHYGIDLVIELPFKYATGSADIFAKGSINILKHIKVDKLIFGSESNNINLLTKIANTQLNNNEFDIKVKQYLKEGLNYPTSLSNAIKDITNISINTPNDLLGISYIKEIIKQKANIEPITIQRTNDFHGEESASSIRNKLKNNQNINEFIPQYIHPYINKTFIDDYYDLIRYKILSTNNLTIYQGIDKDLENRLKKYINKANTLEEYIIKLKTKRYTYNRLKRLMLHILVGYTKEENNKEYNYIRVLGFSGKGKQHLNKIKKELTIPLITNYSNSKGLLDLEYKVNNIIYMNNPKLLNQELKEIVKYHH